MNLFIFSGLLWKISVREPISRNLLLRKSFFITVLFPAGDLRILTFHKLWRIEGWEFLGFALSVFNQSLWKRAATI